MSPDLLASIPVIRRITQSLAMLDAILCPEWEYRYYSFNSQWGPGAEMASMRNGLGDEWFLHFDSAGAAIKGFVHELDNDVSFPQRIQTEVPPEFTAFLNEPAFSMQCATFCYWRRTDDLLWSKVSSLSINDGAAEMLALLVAHAAGYKEWAEDYFEVSLELEAVTAIFAHVPLSSELILALNPDANLDLIYADAQEIGYPSLTM
jgi:hypothetical protein